MALLNMGLPGPRIAAPSLAPQSRQIYTDDQIRALEEARQQRLMEQQQQAQVDYNRALIAEFGGDPNALKADLSNLGDLKNQVLQSITDPMQYGRAYTALVRQPVTSRELQAVTGLSDADASFLVDSGLWVYYLAGQAPVDGTAAQELFQQQVASGERANLDVNEDGRRVLGRRGYGAATDAIDPTSVDIGRGGLLVTNFGNKAYGNVGDNDFTNFSLINPDGTVRTDAATVGNYRLDPTRIAELVGMTPDLVDTYVDPWLLNEEQKADVAGNNTALRELYGQPQYQMGKAITTTGLTGNMVKDAALGFGGAFYDRFVDPENPSQASQAALEGFEDRRQGNSWLLDQIYSGAPNTGGFQPNLPQFDWDQVRRDYMGAPTAQSQAYLGTLPMMMSGPAQQIYAQARSNADQLKAGTWGQPNGATNWGQPAGGSFGLLGGQNMGFGLLGGNGGQSPYSGFQVMGPQSEYQISSPQWGITPNGPQPQQPNQPQGPSWGQIGQGQQPAMWGGPFGYKNPWSVT